MELTPLTLAAVKRQGKMSVITKTENQKCYGCPVKTLEIILAIVSGVLGMVSSWCALQNKPRHAIVIGGTGLFLCNVIWLLRIM